MSSTVAVDPGRRRFLTAATSVVGAVGAGFVAVPFLSSLKPSARTEAAGAPVDVDVSKLEVGQMMTVEWRGKPIWVVRRSQRNIDDLATLRNQLTDPDSEVPQQPEYARNEYRSINPEYAVLVGICTHLGCAPSYRPQIAPEDLGPEWKGGYFCPCHGSRFDLAGRVVNGSPAPTNLVVPPYKYLSETRILVGADEGAA